MNVKKDKVLKEVREKFEGPERPSPILMVSGKEVEVVGEFLYMVRLTPRGKYTRDQVISHLNDNFLYWTLGKEISIKEKEHYHICIIDIRGFDIVKPLIRDFVYLHNPVRGKGFGGAEYNFQVADDINLALTYSLKDGDIQWSANINSKAIDQFRKKSYKKYAKDEFALKWDLIRSEFKTNPQQGIDDLMMLFAKLKSEYRQPINMGYLYQVAVSCDINRTPERAGMYVTDYLDRINPRK